MTPGEFLNEFGAVANAPGGVQRLREMILQLAVQGKLVEQNLDEFVEDLIKKCLNTKNKYIQELKLQKPKIFSNISKSDYPYIIPINWKWVPLDYISNYIQRGKSPKYDDSSEVKIISQKCVRWSGVDITPAKGLDVNVLEKYTKERFLLEGDLLWNSTGTGTVGRACIFKQSNKFKIVADSHVTVIRAPEIVSRYLWCFLASPMIQARFNPEHPKKLVSGTTNQVELSTGSVKALPIPLPPLEEQKRIVAKVDQLMALCDQLETQQQKRSKMVKHTRISALEALANAQGGDELQTAWKRVEENLSMLFEHPDDVEDLKKCVLQNAVMGKLVPQNPDDEPASELLKKIAKEKSELIKKGEIKKQKPLPEIRDDEKPFEIPAGWEWTRLGNVFDVTSSKRIHQKDYTNTGIPFFRSKEIGELGKGKEISTELFISEAQFNGLKDKLGFPKPGDLLLASIGGSIGNFWICDKRDFYYKDGNITKIGSHSFANIDFLGRIPIISSHMRCAQVVENES